MHWLGFNERVVANEGHGVDKLCDDDFHKIENQVFVALFWSPFSEERVLVTCGRGWANKEEGI